MDWSMIQGNGIGEKTAFGLLRTACLVVCHFGSGTVQCHGPCVWPMLTSERDQRPVLYAVGTCPCGVLRATMLYHVMCDRGNGVLLQRQCS